MAFRPPRRFIRLVVELRDGRFIQRKTWTYGHTHRALMNACRKMQQDYPEWRSIEAHWHDTPEDVTFVMKGAARCT